MKRFLSLIRLIVISLTVVLFLFVSFSVQTGLTFSTATALADDSPPDPGTGGGPK